MNFFRFKHNQILLLQLIIIIILIIEKGISGYVYKFLFCIMNELMRKKIKIYVGCNYESVKKLNYHKSRRPKKFHMHMKRMHCNLRNKISNKFMLIERALSVEWLLSITSNLINYANTPIKQTYFSIIILLQQKFIIKNILLKISI